MKIWYNKTEYLKQKNKSFFLYQFNRYENGYADIYIRIRNLSFLIYTHKIIGKLETGIRKHKTIKF